MTTVTNLLNQEPASGEKNHHASEQPTELLKVMHVVNGEHYSGAARVQDLLALELPQFGVEVSFACVKPKLFPDMRRSKESQLFKVPMSNGFDVRAALPLARLIRDNDISIVHTHTPRSVLVGSIAARLANRPMVYHVHSPTSRDSSRPVQNWVNDKVERICLRNASRLIAVSNSLAEHMGLLGFPSSRIRVVPNGTPVLPETNRAAPSREWTVGAIALFRPRKGLEVLLDALAIARKQGRAIRLHAVGPFETEQYKQTIMQRVQELGLDDIIHWAGLSRDVPAELQKIDLFALPSLYGEGLPMVVLEAMSTATPVVASKVDGVPEVVRDGVDGLLVEPNDPEALANAFGRFMDGELDWRKVGNQARTQHFEGFSDVAMARGVAEIYREVAAETARRK